MVSDPEVLLADEPTGDLDRKSAGEILQLLERLNKEYKKTIVMVTHDPHAAERRTASCTSRRARWKRRPQGVRMSFFNLVLVNLGRNKLRTFLTLSSVTSRCSCSAHWEACSTRCRSRSSWQPISTDHAQRGIAGVPDPARVSAAHRGVPGIKDIAVQQWFGGQDPKDPHAFYAQFGVDEPFYRIYGKDMAIVEASPAQVAVNVPPGVDPKLASYLTEMNACVVGKKLLEKRAGSWAKRHSERHDLARAWPFVIRGVYQARNKSFGEEVMFFHWKYSWSGNGRTGSRGIYVLDLSQPDRAADIAAPSTRCSRTPPPRRTPRASRRSRPGSWHVRQPPFVLRVIGSRGVRDPLDRRQHHGHGDPRAHA